MTNKKPGSHKSFLRYMAEKSFGQTPGAPLRTPAKSETLSDDEIMRSVLILGQQPFSMIVHALEKPAKDQPEGEIQYDSFTGICPVTFIDPKYRLLILSAPVLYKALANVRDALRVIEEYGNETGDPTLEDFAGKHADAVQAAMMVSTNGIEAVGRILRNEATEQEKRNKL